ncbi:terpenoid cyclases/Protein prenyltransferase [Durotheca rogersii]|uniref:terpenoid cyclases/Protein prenyltransferase n=1 Tax=Durotheca rogersii TaxID=419775 RepID=UPI002221121F|nr:terpenoid cyclases/Protein prenyltransferase [Durotheca rogersii]KAI5859609.1 terpenoid cyclases/Protein prenyltransferase [Durotheca rogersii]
MAESSSPDQPPLDTARHIRYWQRCLRTLLPHHYVSNDSIRLTLGFFIVAALDLLSSSSSYSEPPSDPLKASLITLDDRKRLRKWVLSLQHPLGGFCGSPHHVLPIDYTTRWDPVSGATVAVDPANANIAATYFALLLLGILADDDGSRAYEGVKRIETLRWLKKLQRDDGSFGEIIDEDRYVGGGRDMRYCYLAATIRWMLGGAELGEAEDINVDALVAHIRRAQTFDGGVGETSMHESHAGYAYCAVAALSLLDLANPDAATQPRRYLHAGIPSIPSLVYFLACRQLDYLDRASNEESEEDAPENHELPDLSNLSVTDGAQLVGFNGRLNKVADTCYTWWVSGALSMLGENKVVDRGPSRKFILEKTQHFIGGFAKHPGGPPDVYHAYLGLAALCTMAGAEGAKEEGLGRFDPRLCVGAEAAARIAKGREGLLARSGDDGDDDELSEDEKEELEQIKKKLDWDARIARIERRRARCRAAGKDPRREMTRWNPFDPPEWAKDDEEAEAEEKQGSTTPGR